MGSIEGCAVTARFPVAVLILLLVTACGGAGGGDAAPVDVPDSGDADARVDTSDVPDPPDALDSPDPADAHPDDDTTPGDLPTDTPPDAIPDPGVPGPTFQRIDLSAVGDIYAMWSAADGSAWAVGAKGLVLRSDGDAFLPIFPPPPTEADLHGVSGDGDTVFVVGAGGIVLRHTPVEGWAVLREPDGIDLYGVSALSAGEAYAVGKGGLVLRFLDGTFTTESTGITYDLFGVSASGAGGVRAVGAYGTLLERGQTAWVRSQISGPVTTLRAIWRAPDGRMAAVGSGGSIALYDGLTWHLQVTNDPSDPGRDLYAVWGAGSDDITAVGDQGVVLHYDGERWSVMTVAGPYNSRADLRGVAARAAAGGATLLAAAGLGSAALELRDDAWYDRSLGVTADLRGVAVADDGSLAIVGADGLILRGAAGRLGAVRLASGGAFNSVSLPWAVGDGGALADLSGALPILVLPTTDEDLTDVWSSPEGTVAVGAKGTVFDLVAGVLTAGANRVLPLRAVCTEGGRVWIAGDQGRLEVDEGQGFRALSTGTSSDLRDLLPLGAGVVVAGDNGLVLECVPTGCTRVFEQPATFLYGLGRTAGSTLAVGWAGTVLRRTSTPAWSPLDPGTLRVFRAVGGAPDGTFAALVGPDGTLVLYRDAVEAGE
jgi:hypothetical protein